MSQFKRTYCCCWWVSIFLFFFSSYIFLCGVAFALADLPCFPISEMDLHAKCCTVFHPFGECVVATSVCCQRWLLQRVTYNRTRMHFELRLCARARVLLRRNTHERRQFTFFFGSHSASWLKSFIYQNLLFSFAHSAICVLCTTATMWANEPHQI